MDPAVNTTPRQTIAHSNHPGRLARIMTFIRAQALTDHRPFGGI
jgi:hypothetical protein